MAVQQRPPAHEGGLKSIAPLPPDIALVKAQVTRQNGVAFGFAPYPLPISPPSRADKSCWVLIPGCYPGLLSYARLRGLAPWPGERVASPRESSGLLSGARLRGLCAGQRERTSNSRIGISAIPLPKSAVK